MGSFRVAVVKRSKKLVRRVRRNPRPYVALGLCIAVVGSYTVYMMNRQLVVDPRTCAPLLALIAEAESKGNYNAYFGNAANKSTNFTEMTVEEVLAWQHRYVADGSPSSAVGRYQMLNGTLAGLVNEQGIDASQKFDKALQDSLAVALLERRGATAYVNKQITKEEFAAELSKEWAGLPRVTGENPEQSYYAGDRLNKALVDVGAVLGAIQKISPAA